MKSLMAILVTIACLPSVVAVAQETTAPEEWRQEVRGNGEAILLIHGGIIAGTPENFLSQEVLGEYQLITYNRRGYSGSPAESGPREDYIQRHAADAAALLRRLGIDHAHVVGHSSGGTIALQLALSYPDLVKSLVLLEAVVPVRESSSISPQRAEAQAEAEALLEAGDFIAALDIFMETAAGLPDWRSENTPDQVREAEVYAPTFFYFEASALGNWVAPQGLVSGELPVLYVSGSESPHPKESVDVIATWFPQTVELEIPAVSHGLHAEDPEAVAKGIANFLN